MESVNHGRVETHKLTQVDDIGQRLQLIAQQVDASQKDPWIRKVALNLVRGAPQHGDEHEDQEIVKTFAFVKQNIEYRQDPRSYDYYATARRTLEMGAGDCDDHTVLLAGLLHNLGFLTGAKVISPDGYNWHIYALAGIRSKAQPTAYVTLDTTQPQSFPGWEPGFMHRGHERLITFEKGRAYETRLR